ncbi:RteC domain-containing protein [Muricauda oceani]|uniref:RteC protein n=2 Tax=Flagellimonas oceani TaxID=2698672 RepID=A0A6G7J0A3_9FLAO|nr:RteC domain-containing protein [Allomuricauda oceani]MBW8244273.1 RteC domain-containing protein [Allomuricauda oceani]QII44080.1 hypothetical protein GVT53_05135 [Allomuricauda oceani]
MPYNEILSRFSKELKRIRHTASDILGEAVNGLALCNQTLEELKQVVEKEGFANRDMEIQFFKYLKIIPMKYLVYYTEVRFCELRDPQSGDSHRLEFLQGQLDKVNVFLGKHIEFLIYIDQDYQHFDKHFFTRKHRNRFPWIKGQPYFKDRSFNTSHDEILARIRGYGLYANYLRGKKEGSVPKTEQDTEDNLKWTGSYAGFVELVYGIQEMGVIDGGREDTKKIIEILGNFLDVPRGNHTRTYNELKSRKGSRVKFLEEMVYRLLTKMEDEDGVDSG